MVLDINPGAAASTPANFTVVGTKLFFTADNGTSGKELYVTNGPTAATISSFDINVGAATSSVDNLTVFNAKLYFTATNGTNGIELWQSDGTVGGTSMVSDLNSGTADSAPDDLFVYNTDLYFSATTTANGRELYKMNSANVISLVKDLNPGAPDGMTGGGANFLAYNSNLYFVANNGINGAELWKSDGTTVNTAMLKDINPTGNSAVTNMFVFDGKIVFQATDGALGAELFVSDGTAQGTGLAADIFTGASGSSPKDFIIYNNELYFTATDATTGAELWKATTAPILGVTQLTQVSNKMNLYPNPAKNYFQIKSEAVIEKIEIYSTLGQLLKTFSQQEQYDVNDLAKGMYVLKILGGGSVTSINIIVE
jgi:ELWxxDGT repeat protein